MYVSNGTRRVAMPVDKEARMLRTRILSTNNLSLLGILFVTSCVPPSHASAQVTAQLIWSADVAASAIENGFCYFRKEFVAHPAQVAKLRISSSGIADIFINGARIDRMMKSPQEFDVTRRIRAGKNVIAIRVSNQTSGKHGIAATLNMQTDGETSTVVTDVTWKTSTRPLPLWNKPFYSDAKWDLAKQVMTPAEKFHAATRKSGASKTSSLRDPLSGLSDLISNPTLESTTTPGDKSNSEGSVDDSLDEAHENGRS